MTGPLLGFGALATGVAARRADGVVVDLSHLGEAYRQPSLSSVLALGPQEWARMREAVDRAPEADPSLIPLVPVQPGDYVDFYACEHHVVAMGRRFRPGQPPLPPAWRHVPLGYHGRTSTMVVSGEPVYRPSGLLPGEPPGWGPTRRLDVEVELGFVVGRGNERGRPVAAPDAWDRIFGVVVVNDWSARDIQAFESMPLGPHLGKSFCTTVSPWVVPLDLLPRVPIEGTGVGLAPLLCDDGHDGGFDIDLALSVDGHVVSRTNARHLSWSPAQMYAALTSNGATVRPGDLFATGTISGPEAGSGGSLLELGLPFLSDGQTAAVTSPLLGSAIGRVLGGPAAQGASAAGRPSEREASGSMGGSEREDLGPSGPSELEASAPVGPSEREASAPGGRSEREVQVPSGPSARSTVERGGPSDREVEPCPAT